MARLPQVGGDAGNWGDVLNDYLSQSHNTDGTLKTDTVGAAQLKPGAVTSTAIGDGAVQESKLSSAVQTKLNDTSIADGAVTTAKLADGAVTPTKLSTLGTANGVASLDGNAKLPESQIPERLGDAELSATIGGLSYRPLFYDDFTTKLDGEIYTSDPTDSGHAYGVRLGGTEANPGTPPLIVDGYLTHERTDITTTQSFYLSSGQLSPSASKAAKIGVEFVVPAGVDPAETLTLVISAEDWTYPASNGDPRSVAAAHFTFDEGGTKFDTYDGPSTLNTVARYIKLPWVRGMVQRIEVHLRDGRAAITMPDGEVILTPYEPKFDTQRGPFVTLQLYGGAEVQTPVHVLRWWADTEERTNLDSLGVQLWDMARAVQTVQTVPGQVIGSLRTSGSNLSTPIEGTLTTLLTMSGVTVPWTKRLRVQGLIHIQQLIPATEATNPFLYFQADVTGTGTPGKMTVVYGTKSPYNGDASNYHESSAVPYAMEIDLSESTIKQGSSVIVNLKAAGTTGMFTFINYADGSGSQSTLRSSTMDILVWPPS